MPTDDARGVHPSAADNVVKDVRAAGEKVASDVRLISVLRGRLDTIVGADSDRYLAGVSVEVSEKQRDGAIRVLEPSVENGANRFQVWLNDRLSEGLGKTQECQDHRHAEHLSPPHRLHGTHGCLFYGFVGGAFELELFVFRVGQENPIRMSNGHLVDGPRGPNPSTSSDPDCSDSRPSCRGRTSCA